MYVYFDENMFLSLWGKKKVSESVYTINGRARCTTRGRAYVSRVLLMLAGINTGKLRIWRVHIYIFTFIGLLVI